LGWCQPGGASPNGEASFNSTSDFCVGAFLLGGSELATMLKNPKAAAAAAAAK
jgi:hypothetical protein